MEMEKEILHHQRHVHFRKCASTEQVNFPTSVFLGWCTEELHPAIDSGLRQGIGESQKSCHTGRGDEVMATCMANSRQGIVPCVEVDCPVPISTDDLERRFQAVCVSYNRVIEFFQKVTDGIVGLVLFVREFRILVDLSHGKNQ